MLCTGENQEWRNDVDEQNNKMNENGKGSEPSETDILWMNPELRQNHRT